MPGRYKTARWQWMRLVTGCALTVVALLLTMITCWLALTFASQQPAFILWLALLQPWLQLWRLLLYTMIILFWCCSVRRQMLKAATYWQVRRLELLILMLWVTIEGCLWVRSMTAGGVL